METTKGWKVQRESEGKRVGGGWKVCRGQMCDCEGWELWGKDTWQDKSSHAGCTDTWHSYVGSVREHCYRVLSQATHHRVTTQGTATGHCHRIPSQGTRHWKHCHESLPRINATGHCQSSTSQWHVNKDTPDDFSSGVSEERQLPTLPPGLAVPSAMTGLASLFGMGRGGSPSL